MKTSIISCIILYRCQLSLVCTKARYNSRFNHFDIIVRPSRVVCWVFLRPSRTKHPNKRLIMGLSTNKRVWHNLFLLIAQKTKHSQQSIKFSAGRWSWDASLFTAWKVSKYGVTSGHYFPVFIPNTGKYRPEITPYFDTFYAVIVLPSSFLVVADFMVVNTSF